MGRPGQERTDLHLAVELLANLPDQGFGLRLARLDLPAGKLPLPAAVGMGVALRDQDAPVPAEDRRDHADLLQFRSTAISSPALESR